jgi:hypothetical protein
MLVGVLILVSTLAFSRGPKSETIEASAFGTGTQMGQEIGVTLDIYDFSTPDDRQILVDAFTKESGVGQCTLQNEGRGSLFDHWDAGL